MSDWKALKIPQDYEVGKVRPIKKTTSSKPYSRPVIRNGPQLNKENEESNHSSGSSGVFGFVKKAVSQTIPWGLLGYSQENQNQDQLNPIPQVKTQKRIQPKIVTQNYDRSEFANQNNNYIHNNNKIQPHNNIDYHQENILQDIDSQKISRIKGKGKEKEIEKEKEIDQYNELLRNVPSLPVQSRINNDDEEINEIINDNNQNFERKIQDLKNSNSMESTESIEPINELKEINENPKSVIESQKLEEVKEVEEVEEVKEVKESQKTNEYKVSNEVMKIDELMESTRPEEVKKPFFNFKPQTSIETRPIFSQRITTFPTLTKEPPIPLRENVSTSTITTLTTNPNSNYQRMFAHQAPPRLVSRAMYSIPLTTMEPTEKRKPQFDEDHESEHPSKRRMIAASSYNEDLAPKPSQTSLTAKKILDTLESISTPLSDAKRVVPAPYFSRIQTRQKNLQRKRKERERKQIPRRIENVDNEDIEKENIENQQNLIEQEKQQQQPTTTEKITENQTSGKNISFSFLANPTIIEKKSSTEADKEKEDQTKKTSSKPFAFGLNSVKLPESQPTFNFQPQQKISSVAPIDPKTFSLGTKEPLKSHPSIADHKAEKQTKEVNLSYKAKNVREKHRVTELQKGKHSKKNKSNSDDDEDEEIIHDDEVLSKVPSLPLPQKSSEFEFEFGITPKTTLPVNYQHLKTLSDSQLPTFTFSTTNNEPPTSIATSTKNFPQFSFDKKESKISDEDQDEENEDQEQDEENKNESENENENDDDEIQVESENENENEESENENEKEKEKEIENTQKPASLLTAFGKEGIKENVLPQKPMFPSFGFGTANPSTFGSKSFFGDKNITKEQPKEIVFDTPTPAIEKKETSTEILPTPIMPTAITTTTTTTPGWSCSDCLAPNKDSDLKCACCEADKPGTEKPKDKNGPSFNFSVPTTSNFTFGATTNNATSTSSSTTTTNPTPSPFTFGSTTTSTPFQPSTTSTLPKPDITPTPITTSVITTTTTTTPGWSCSDCLASNKDSDLKCACCEADKPGTEKPKDKNGPSFNFSVPTTSKFIFGSTSTSTDPIQSNPTPSSGFIFGSGTTNNLTTTPLQSFNPPTLTNPPKSEITLSTTTATTSPVNMNAEDDKPGTEKPKDKNGPSFNFSVPTTSNYTFGATTTNTPSTSTSTTQNTSTSGFIFGSTTNNSTSQPPPTNTPQSISTPNFTFGSTSNNSTTTPSSQISSTPTLTNPTQSNITQVNPTPSFTFGSTPNNLTTNTSSTTNNSTSQPPTNPTPNFTFGSTPNNLTTNTPSQTPSTNNFVFGSSQMQTGGQKVGFGTNQSIPFGNSEQKAVQNPVESEKPKNFQFGGNLEKPTFGNSTPLQPQLQTQTQPQFQFQSSSQPLNSPQIPSFQPQQPQQPQSFVFGSNSNQTNQPFAFGSNSNQSNLNPTPSFGATSLPNPSTFMTNPLQNNFNQSFTPPQTHTPPPTTLGFNQQPQPSQQPFVFGATSTPPIGSTQPPFPTTSFQPQQPQQPQSFGFGMSTPPINSNQSAPQFNFQANKQQQSFNPIGFNQPQLQQQQPSGMMSPGNGTFNMGAGSDTDRKFKQAKRRTARK